MEPYQAKRKNTKQSKFGAFSYVIGTAEVLKADVGRYCSIATGSVIGLTEHPTDRLSTHSLVYNSPRYLDHPIFAAMKAKATPHPLNRKRTRLGHDVWVGANSVVLCGVTVGTGAIIGAGAVVTKDVPPYAIVGGVPAKIIRYRFSPELIERLLQSEWWDYHLDQSIIDTDYADVALFLDRLEALKKEGALRKLSDVLSEYNLSQPQRTSVIERVRSIFRKHATATTAFGTLASLSVLILVVLWEVELAEMW